MPLNALTRHWARHLYLRIWLAVVLGVAVLMLVVGWAWRVTVEHNTPAPLPREWVLLNANGEVLATTVRRPGPGAPLEFDLTLPDGQQLELRVQRNGDGRDEGGLAERRSGRMSPHGAPHASPHAPPHSPPLSSPYSRPEPPWWAKAPYGFFWMLGLIGLAVALGLYPVVRRLTNRLEGLQRGVQRWGDGDLSVRVPVQGHDEVADLSARFNAAAERIEGLMASQKSLLANASHELRSPLARIRMGLELMETPTDDTPLRQRTRSEILRNMNELDQLIDEILLASRLDAKEADLGTVEAVDWVGLCAEECARVGAVLDVPQGLAHLESQGVAKLLRRMVRNLLENARRYGSTAGDADLAADVAVGGSAVAEGLASQEPVPSIVLTLTRQETQVHLQVCDRGPGVPVAWRERIFEPFFRLPGASERVGGVGLGLSLVKSIAERHGGRVTCADRPGGGACFKLELPHKKTANA
jgi:two-component system OmpR family sensor kinase